MITLSPSQEAAVTAFQDFIIDDGETEFLISGFAGSGKSFLVSYLADLAIQELRLIRTLDPTVPEQTLFYTATTNKAAEVLRNMLCTKVVTIHSLLGLKVHNNYKTGATKLVQKNSPSNLDHSIIFIDEASMINRELLAIIRKYIKAYTNCKVVYIGDSYQLPPVMEDVCPIFTEGKNMHFLTEIQRQIAGNPIIQLAAGYRGVLDDHTKDWPEILTDSNHIFHYNDMEDFWNAMKAAYNQPHEATDLKVIAWANTKVHTYNNWLRKLEGRTEPFELNEVVVSSKPLIIGGEIVGATDSIHTIRDITDHKLEGVKGYMLDLDVGRIFQPKSWLKAKQLSDIYVVDAKKTHNWEPYFNIKNNWADLRPIHASTCHKSQGSTYKEVFVDLSNIGTNKRWREVARLAYVAITRTSNKVHIFGNLTYQYNKGPVVDPMEAFNVIR